MLAVTGGADPPGCRQGLAIWPLSFAFFCRAGDHRRDSINCQGHLEDRARLMADDLRVLSGLIVIGVHIDQVPGCIRADVLLGAGR